MTRFFLLTIICILGFTTVKSQVVNIERMRLKADTTGYFGSGAVTFNLIENKKRIMNLGGKLHLMHKRPKATYLLISNLNLIRAGEEDFVNNGFQHFRFNNNLNETFIFELFLQAQFNELLKVKNRDLAGTGIRIKLLDRSKIKVYSGLLYMYEYEEIKGENIINRNHRMSDYLAMSLYFNDIASFESTTYYQPRIKYIGDYRISSENSLGLHITKRLVYQTGFQILFDSRPPIDIPETSYSFHNSLKYNF